MKTYRNASQPPTRIFEKVSEKESMTIPDQAMSVREILNRYTTGQPLSVNNFQETYLENVPLYDTRRKSTIDMAIDSLQNQEMMREENQKIFDNQTKLSEIIKKEQKPKQIENQSVTPKPE